MNPAPHYPNKGENMNSTCLQEYEPETSIEMHKSIRFHPDLSHGEKIFYAEIKSMSKNSKCHFSARKLSKHFGVTHPTITKWIKNLIDLNLIEVGIDYKSQGHKHFLTIKE